MGKTGTITMGLALAAMLVPYSIKKEESKLTVKAFAYKFTVDTDKTILSVPGEILNIVKEKKQPMNVPLFTKALQIAEKRGKVSAAYLEKKLGVGTSCAEAFIEMMAEYGVIGEAQGNNYPVIMDHESLEALAQTI